MTAYVLERAWVDGAVHDEVYVEIEGGRFATVALARDAHPVAPARRTTSGCKTPWALMLSDRWPISSSSNTFRGW